MFTFITYLLSAGSIIQFLKAEEMCEYMYFPQRKYLKFLFHSMRCLQTKIFEKSEIPGKSKQKLEFS